MDPSHPISSFHQIPPQPRIRGFALSFVLSLRINIKRESPDALDADDDMVSGEGQRSGSGYVFWADYVQEYSSYVGFMRDGAQWFVENTDIKLVGNDDPLQGEIAWNRTPRELGISAYALQQLGGSHAATSKQIRELMKVDGLTNDEVKSHLQLSFAKKATTDPSEVQGQWNIGGEPCSGYAINGTDNYGPAINPGIVCNCSYDNNATCHITQLIVYGLNKRGGVSRRICGFEISHIFEN
ncbi:hypothetical protein TB2_035680 [Malus domestica]